MKEDKVLRYFKTSTVKNYLTDHFSFDSCQKVTNLPQFNSNFSKNLVLNTRCDIFTCSLHSRFNKKLRFSMSKSVGFKKRGKI